MQLQLQGAYAGPRAGATASNVKTSVSAIEEQEAGKRKRGKEVRYFHLKWALQTGLCAINIARQLPLAAKQPGCGWCANQGPSVASPSLHPAPRVASATLSPFRPLFSLQLGCNFNTDTREYVKAPTVRTNLGKRTHARTHARDIGACILPRRRNVNEN